MENKIRYPKVGETFYWIDEEGDIHEETCMKIFEDPKGQIETIYYTYVSENGGGIFINEEDIVDPDSEEVEEYRKQHAVEKFEKIKELMRDDYVRKIIYDMLHSNIDDSKIINSILTEFSKR